MKISMILIALVISFNRSYCQPTFKNDISYTSSNASLIKQIDSSFHLQKDNEFEFQFGIGYAKTMQRQLFILTLKDNQWHGRLFERKVRDVDTLIEIPINQNGLADLWKSLNRNQILTIPKEEDLRDKYGNEINDPVHDGISYNFSLINKMSKRNYYYHCPKSFYEDYKYIKEYNQVVNIIKIIFNYCGINLHYIC